MNDANPSSRRLEAGREPASDRPDGRREVTPEPATVTSPRPGETEQRSVDTSQPTSSVTAESDSATEEPFIPDGDPEPDSETTELREYRSELIAAARADGASVPECARRAKCSERTVRRTLKDPDVRRKVREARDAKLDQILGGVSVLGDQALEVLRRVMTCGRPTEELAAARLVLTELRARNDAAGLQEDLQAVKDTISLLRSQMGFEDDPAVTPQTARVNEELAR